MRKLVLLIPVVMLGPALGDAAEPATVRLIDKTVTLLITFEDGTTMKVTDAGTRLPAGTYFVKSLRFYKKDEKDRVWELRSMDRLGGMKSLTVAAGQEKVIDPGPPVGLHMWARQGDPPDDGQVTINITAVGKYDAVYYPGAFRGRARPPAPVIRIVTEDGKTLHEARVSVVESTGACRYVWKIPPGFKDKYKVDIKAWFGPYEYKSNREGHFFEIK